MSSNNNRFLTPNPKRIRREKTTLSSNGDEEKEKDSVHVYCRLRPLKQGSEAAQCIKVVSSDTLSLIAAKREVLYKFKHIFTAFSTQKELFNHVAFPLLEDLLHGKNGLLFAYGVTGSGKTYTLTGDQQEPGIMPRCIDTIFNSIGEYQAAKCVIKSDRMNGFEIQTENDAIQDRLTAVRNMNKTPKTPRKGAGEKICYKNDGQKINNINENNLYAVFVSYVEIYNNSVFDLLDESSGKTLQNKILREDYYKNMYVNGVVEVEVKSAQEAFDVFNSGQIRKRVAATSLNAGSSRSHSIFNIRVVQLEQVAVNSDGQFTVPADNVIKIGQLSLVDLAGSERTNRTNNTGMRLKEASSINNSLMSLRTCLEIMRDNQQNKGTAHVPYRDSRLTFLFKHYFEGSGTIKMMVCINPSLEDYEENLQVLKFAEMTQDVKISKAEIRYTPLKTTNKNKENQTPGVTPSKAKSNGNFLPEMPIVKLDFQNMEECQSAIEKVIKVLKIRKHKSAALDKEIEERQSEMRKRLVSMNQQCLLSSAEMKSLKSVIHKERQKIKNMNTKMNDLESHKQDLLSKNEKLQGHIQALKDCLNEKEAKITQEMMERERVKKKFVIENEKMTHELDAKLRRQREHLNAAMKAKDDKLRMVKGILESELPPAEMNNIEMSYTAGVSSQGFQSAVKSLGSQVTPMKSSSNIHRRNMQTPASRKRRSRSVGEVWLEHNVIKPCPLNTVMQPNMNKRKSVSKLDKASDITNPKQSKYCLLTQEPDTEGEMETKLYKADIIPTLSGGAQVVINDVERLKQESPTRE